MLSLDKLIPCGKRYLRPFERPKGQVDRWPLFGEE